MESLGFENILTFIQKDDELSSKFYDAKKRNDTATAEKLRMQMKQNEDAMVRFVVGFDFSDEKVNKNALHLIGQVLKMAENNERISRFRAKLLHVLTTKIAMQQMGLSDVKINYIDKEHWKTDGAAYYLEQDNSINFKETDFDGGKSELNLVDRYPIEKGAKKERLDAYINMTGKIFHELRHAEQIKNRDKQRLDLDSMTPETYTMQKQEIARLSNDIVFDRNKYFDKGKMYNPENHDDFFIELDANSFAKKATMELFSKTNSEAFNLVKENGIAGMPEADAGAQTLGQNAVWEHKTNNGKKKVRANYKSSIIIDHIVKNYPDKDALFAWHPELALTYERSGKKKTLLQVRTEQKQKIDQILAADPNAKQKVAQISALYETVVKSDPLLSFEEVMHKIAYMKPSQAKELDKAKKQLLEIAEMMEDVDAKEIEQLFKKYSQKAREVSGGKNIRSSEDSNWFVRKTDALNEVSRKLFLNKEVRDTNENTKKEEAKKQRELQQEKKDARALLKQTFPELDDSVLQEKYSLTKPSPAAAKQMKLEQNQTKLMLESAKANYLSDAQKSKENPKVSDYEITQAINILFPGQPTADERKIFRAEVEAGRVVIPKSIYSPKPEIRRLSEDEMQTEDASSSSAPESGSAMRGIERKPFASNVVANGTKVERFTETDEGKRVVEEERRAEEQHRQEDANRAREEERKKREEERKHNEEQYDEYGVRIPDKKNSGQRNSQTQSFGRGR